MSIRIFSPWRILGALLVPLLLAVPGPAVSQNSCTVAPGYDLFTTQAAGTTLGVQPVLAAFHYEGVPAEVYDFPDVGPRAVGETDTIVARLGAATPTQPLVPVELVLLQLRSVESPQHFVTVQSARGPTEPPGLPSEGVLAIRFRADCQGGTLDSLFVVHFDVRLGGVDGPILVSGSETISANGIPWQHAADVPRELVEQGRIAAHQVRDTLTSLIPGVNTNLNGVDEAADFHPGVPVA